MSQKLTTTACFVQEESSGGLPYIYIFKLPSNVLFINNLRPKSVILILINNGKNLALFQLIIHTV